MSWQAISPSGPLGLGVWEVRAVNRPAVVAQLARLVYAHRYGVDPVVAVACVFPESDPWDLENWGFTGPNAAHDDASTGGTSSTSSMVVFLREAADPAQCQLPAYAQVCYWDESPTQLYVKSVELDPDAVPTEAMAQDLYMHNCIRDNVHTPDAMLSVRPDGFRDQTGYAIRVLRCGRYMAVQCIVEGEWEVPDQDDHMNGAIYAPSTIADYAALFTRAPATWFACVLDTKGTALYEAALGLKDLSASLQVAGQLRGIAYNFAWTFKDPVKMAYFTLCIGRWVAELLGSDHTGRLWEQYPFPASFKDFLLALKDAIVRTAEAVDNYIESLMSSGILFVRVTAHLSAVTVEIVPQEES